MSAPNHDPSRAFIELCTTCASNDEAHHIARHAIDARLAACAHIIPVDSYYRWQGVVTGDKEVRVAFKTTEAKQSELMTLIRSLHSYVTPALYATPITGSDDYLSWIAASTA